MTIKYTVEDLIQQAYWVEGENVGEGDEGHINPENASWSYIQNYPVKSLISLMKNKQVWIDWLKDEREYYEDIRGADYFDDLYTNPIRDPIIITIVNKKPYIWDGWHRLASVIASDRHSIPVIVGQDKEYELKYQRDSGSMEP